MFEWLQNLVFGSWTRHMGRLEPESRFVVTVDAEGVSWRRPHGQVESVRWVDLGAVIVETNDTGPWGIDVWWLLLGKDAAGTPTGCVIPQGATGETELLEALQHLPGFDNRALGDAMACTDNRRVLCWRAGPEP